MSYHLPSVILLLLGACSGPGTGVPHPGPITDPEASGVPSETEDVVVLPPFVVLRAGPSSTCGIREGGELECWGDGALSAPVSVADARSLDIGFNATCVLRRGGEVLCWGRRFSGGAQVVAQAPEATEIHVGRSICVSSPSQVRCGRVGPGTELVAVTGLAPPIRGMGAGIFNCALHAPGVGAADPNQAAPSQDEPMEGGGQVSCWQAGQAPEVKEGLGSVTALAVGAEHACAVSAGELFCWGLNRYGQAGQEPTGKLGRRFRTVERPSRVGALSDHEAVFAGGSSTCVRSTTGEISCFGSNTHGQLGSLPDPEGTQVRGATAPHRSQSEVIDGLTAELIVLGDQHGCALSNGEVACWGLNDRWQTGLVPAPAAATPTPVMNLESASELALGSGYSCARNQNGAVLCWGGYLANFDQDLTSHRPFHRESAAPTVVAEVDDAVQIAMGFSHGCAREGRGRVLCWGRNEASQVAPHRWSDLRSRAIRVGGVRDSSSIAAAGFHSCTTSIRGLFCWGGIHGEVTGNRRTTRPRRLSGLSEADVSGLLEVAAGPRHSCLLNRAGEVRCWGQNDLGGSGGTLRVTQTSPNPIALPHPADQVAVGEYHSCARLRDGAVHCWGAFADRQSAPSASVQSEPTVVANISQATALSCGGGHCCALAGTPSQVQCWGLSQFGQAGTFAARTLDPHSVVLEDAVEVAVGKTHSCARQRSGQVQCWGDNRGGALGNGRLPFEYRPHPLELPDR